MENGNKYPSSPPFLQTRVRKSVLAMVAASSIVALSVTAMLLLLASVGMLPSFDSPDIILLIFVCVFLTLMFYTGHYGRISRKVHLTENLTFHLSITIVIAVFMALRLYVRN